MKKQRVRIPKNLQGILWSKEVKDIDPEKDRVYLIHQILRYGGLKDIAWLFKIYPLRAVRKIFLEEPLPVYSRSALNFAKNFLLKLKGVNLNPRRYVKSLY